MQKIPESIDAVLSASESELALLLGLAAIILAGYAIHVVWSATQKGDK